MSNDQRRIGFAASSHPRAVSIPEHFDFLRPTVPSKSFTTSNSSSLAFASSELLRFDSSLAPFGPSLTYPWVFGPLRDFTRAQPLLRDGSRPPLRSVIRFSRPLDVFLRTRARRLIPSRCHVQDPVPFRGFSPRAATLPLRKELPPGRCFPVSLTDFRRLPLDEDLGFEAFIRARPRSLQSRYSQSCAPLPSSGSAPPGI
jgi:hypothetical protein